MRSLFIQALICAVLGFSCCSNAQSQTKANLPLLRELPQDDVGTIPATEVIDACSKLLDKYQGKTMESSATLLARRGEAYLRQGKLKKAFADFDALCKLLPKSHEALAMRGRVLAMNCRFEEAVADANAAIALAPSAVGPHCALAEIFLNQGKLDDCKTSAKTAVRLKATHARAYYILARAALDQKKYAESLEMLNRYLELRPLSSDLYPEDPYVLRGFLLLQLNRPADGLNNYLLARKLNPKSIFVASSIHHAYSDMHKWNLAAEAAADCVKLEPTKTEYQSDLAFSLAKAGAIKRARKSLEDLLQRPNSKEAFAADIGIVYFLIGEDETAMQFLKTAIDNSPEHNTAMWGLTMIMNSSVNSKLRDGQKSLEYARKLYHIDKQQGSRPMVLLLLADSEAEIGNFKEAIKLVEKGRDMAGPQREYQEFEERLRLFEKSQPYRYRVPDEKDRE